MAARTGKEYISGLRDGREVWIGGQRVSDVTEYEPFAGAVQSVAGLYDLQHDHADDCLFAHPETGELTNISHLIPRSREDIARRGTALAHAARYSVGLLGRSPDYVNVSLAGHAGRSDVWSRNGNEEGAANLVRFQADLARDDLALTHAIIRPTVDKGIGDLAAADGQMALHKVADTADGIVVRGAMVLSTLAPFSDEVAVYPGQPLPKDAQKYAIAFSAPIASPGLKLLCRDAFSTDMAHFDAPFSGRFDEQDAFLIFDDVEIPRSRVFIDGNTEVWNAAMMNGWTANIMQQTTIRAEAKLRFAYELVSRFCKSINASDPRTKELLGELWTYAEMTRALLVAAEAGAREWGNGIWFCDERPFRALRPTLPQWFPRVNEIIKLLGSHNLLATPSEAAFDNPELRPLLDKYLQGAHRFDAKERVRLFRAAWDFAGTALGGRNELYERFYLGSAARSYQLDHDVAQFEMSESLVDPLLRIAEAAEKDEQAPAFI
ncbi:4-hydroxyphenylacetate 3-hydroxylase N-terminal domain-containing protein [Mycolicibacterium fortuitum]|uniref:4-hydroxyphenylacetate 3-hydroxylase family protein n=1 Tax=Mycolicibacterium fortuitum TaxID=1766 RepID=UPI003A877816